MDIEETTGLDRPELEPYLTLRERTAHWAGGHCVAEGARAVEALLSSGWDVLSLLTTRAWLGALRERLARERFRDTKVFVGPEKLIDGIVGFKLHQRVMAIARVPGDMGLDAVAAGGAPGTVHVALEGIEDAENMGMILRNAAAFGATTLIAGRDCCSPYLRRSVRVSLGAAFSVRIHRPERTIEVLERLRSECGWRVVGATPRGGEASLPAAARSPLCILFGSEARGLSDAARGLCDDLFSIPIEPAVDSLNVANAVAIALFAATRISR